MEPQASLSSFQLDPHLLLYYSTSQLSDLASSSVGAQLVNRAFGCTLLSGAARPPRLQSLVIFVGLPVSSDVSLTEGKQREEGGLWSAEPRALPGWEKQRGN